MYNITMVLSAHGPFVEKENYKFSVGAREMLIFM